MAKQFRENDKQLEAWLIGSATKSEQSYPKPSVVFAKHGESCSRFKLAKNSLNMADHIDESRKPFAKRAADLLLRHVTTHDTGPMREWKARHGVEFAPNGQVAYRWQTPSGKLVTSEWHLKEGDRTTAERAARVYFDCYDDADGVEVFVFYVGPHPPDGEYEAQIEP